MYIEQFTIGCILAHSWHGHLARVHGLEGRATRPQPLVKCSSELLQTVNPPGDQAIWSANGNPAGCSRLAPARAGWPRLTPSRTNRGCAFARFQRQHLRFPRACWLSFIVHHSSFIVHRSSFECLPRPAPPLPPFAARHFPQLFSLHHVRSPPRIPLRAWSCPSVPFVLSVPSVHYQEIMIILIPLHSMT